MFRKSTGVTILGAGDVEHETIAIAQRAAPFLVCADGGANLALRLGLEPDLIIGDLDSISPDAVQHFGQDRLVQIDEQETTDFDKCVRSLVAPFFVAVGVSAPRIDHAMASLNVLMRHGDRKIMLLTDADVCFPAPPRLSLSLPVGSRMSLFPLSETTGVSRGLKWPIDGLNLSPTGLIATSNETDGSHVLLEFAAPGMVIIMPVRFLSAALHAFLQAPVWKEKTEES